MDINLMRSEVINAYPGDRWRNKVALMRDGQVIAIYKSLQSRGKFDVIPKKKETGPSFKITESEPVTPKAYERQITIWDILKGDN